MPKYFKVAIPVIVGCVIVLLIAFYHDYQPWLSLTTGSRNNGSTPPNYNYWSGFGSVFPWSMGIIGAILTHTYISARARNCHVDRCWRIASHPVAKGEFTTCKRHHRQITGHPDKLTVEHLRRHHEKVTNGD